MIEQANDEENKQQRQADEQERQERLLAQQKAEKEAEAEQRRLAEQKAEEERKVEEQRRAEAEKARLEREKAEKEAEQKRIEAEKAQEQATLDAMNKKLTPQTDAWAFSDRDELQKLQEQGLVDKPNVGNDDQKIQPTENDKDSNGIADTLDKLFTKAEGDYSAVNLGAKHGYKSSSRNLSDMTVKEVMAAQSRGDFNAAGHYQIIKGTLKSGVKALGLTGDEKFTPELQDRIFKEYLVGKAGGKVKLANDSTVNVHGKLKDYLTGKSNDEDAALVAMAQEWASFPMPYDFKKNLVEKDVAGNTIKDEKGNKVYKEHLIKAGASFHTGSANNKANMTINEARQALRDMRAMNMKYHTIK